MDNTNTSGKYLDLNKRYDILVPKTKDAQENLYDANYFDKESGEIKADYLSMSFREDTYCLMEWHLFNAIDKECDLLINMYDDEVAEQEHLPKILELTDKAITNSDNDEFIKLAKEFRELVEKAIEYGTCVGFYF